MPEKHRGLNNLTASPFPDQPTSAEKDATRQRVFNRTRTEGRKLPVQRSSAPPPRARLPVRDPRPAPLRSRRQPRKGAKPPAPKVLLAAVCTPFPRPGLEQPVVRDRDPGRTAPRLLSRAPQVPRGAPGSDQRPAPNLGGWGRTAPLPPATEPRRARLTRERSRGRPARCVKPRRPLRGPDGSGSPRPRAYLEPAPGASAAAAPGAPTIRASRPRSTLSPAARRAPPSPGRGSRAPRGLPGAAAAARGRARTPAAAPARRAAAAPGHAEEEPPPPPPAPGLGPRERDGRARPRSRSALAAPRLPEGPAGSEEEETSPPPPPPPPPGAEEKVRPPARRR
ncbi:basic proline-rich protein-like [Enhydra lutris kenyoni]|uniref:Basic proline-rich protein-like n=1 Tax=Enhydra lutris kenyoni TaxID=391180 RepID=A0A2Y9JE94_ENHLU|nr:basic proline-rich protein-like [Enhydra lutris kenyoni]